MISPSNEKSFPYFSLDQLSSMFMDFDFFEKLFKGSIFYAV